MPWSDLSDGDSRETQLRVNKKGMLKALIVKADRK
jgi:hypothetical protein